MSQSTVVLKNGKRELKKNVQSAMLALHSLLEREPATFNELVGLCRTGNRIHFKAWKRLGELGFVSEGDIPEIVLDIVTIAVFDNHPDFRITDPVVVHKTSFRLVKQESRPRAMQLA